MTTRRARRPGDRGAGEGRLRAERLRLGVRGARPRRRRRSRRRWSISASRRSSSASPRSRVGWAAHELAVKVTPSAERLPRAREGDARRSPCARPTAAAPPPGSEVALAAVDEGLLELRPTSRWKLLDAMMGRARRRRAKRDRADAGDRQAPLRPEGAARRAAAAGAPTTRELFDTLLLWQRARAARRQRRRDGRDAAQRFAHQLPHRRRRDRRARSLRHRRASIRATQDLMVLSGLPPLVREGDRFRATFTLRNTTDAPAESGARRASIERHGAAAPQSAVLAAGRGARARLGRERAADRDERRLGRDGHRRQEENAADATIGCAQGRAAGRARGAGAHAAGDVCPARRSRSRWPSQRPADAMPGRGGVDVQLQPRLAGGLPGVRDWLAAYPYSCLEQRVSRAVGSARPHALGRR